MPDQDRKPSFILHTLSQDPGDGAVRCPSCRGTGVTFQADCVCCGREVPVVCTTQAPNGPIKLAEADIIADSVKALSIKTEVIPDECKRSSSPESIIVPSFAQECKPVIIPVPAGPRPSNNERQRRSNVGTLRSCDRSERSGVGTRESRYGSLSQLQDQPGDSRSAVRIYQQPQLYVTTGRSSSSSQRRSSTNYYGTVRGIRGSTGGAHHTFKGVRTRKGVKGYLVEIRPPKWKRTIWLGTYNTSEEAAGAYDAGVFYTKKTNTKYNFPTKKTNTKYNFPTSEGAFPPLPAHLKLDTADSMDQSEIKLFVQNQARAAASRIGNTMRTQLAAQISVEKNNPVILATNSNSGQLPTSSGSCLTDSHDSLNADHVLQTASCNSSSEVNIGEIESEFQIPMDLGYLGQCLHDETAAEEAEKDMFMDYTNYVNCQQGGPDDQELLLLLLPDEEADQMSD